MDEENTSTPMDVDENLQTDQVLVTQLDDKTMQPVEESDESRMFVCGQCNLGFITIDECKEHMVKVNLIGGLVFMDLT